MYNKDMLGEINLTFQSNLVEAKCKNELEKINSNSETVLSKFELNRGGRILYKCPRFRGNILKKVNRESGIWNIVKEKFC